MNRAAHPMRQQPLPLADTRATAHAYRIAAETALRDPFRSPAEREARRQHYLQQAEQIERARTA